MTRDEIATYLTSLSAEDLESEFKVAVLDLEEATLKENNSEWHHACMAAARSLRTRI